MATGKELGRLKAPSRQRSLQFSRDGKRLASAGGDTCILVWDVSRLDAERLPARRLEQGELMRLLKDLEGEDARKAHDAINTLAMAPSRPSPC